MSRFGAAVAAGSIDVVHTVRVRADRLDALIDYMRSRGFYLTSAATLGKGPGERVVEFDRFFRRP